MPGSGPAGPGPGDGLGWTDAHPGGATAPMSEMLYAAGAFGLSAGSSARGRRLASPAQQPAPQVDAASAATPAQDRTRTRKRRRAAAPDHGYRYEYLAADTEPVSERGGGPLGFTGVAPKDCRATGLTTLAGGALDPAPRVPMLPSGWGNAS